MRLRVTVFGLELLCVEINEGVWEILEEEPTEVRVGALDPSDEGGRLILTPHET